MTKFRPWTNSSDEVDLIWYPAEPQAPVLGYPSKIRQLDNAWMPWIAEGVGEVYGADRVFQNLHPIPFQKFGHVCGDRDDFTEGGVRDTSLPDVQYDRNHIPICCGPAFIGEGGGAGSGMATVTVTPGPVRYRVQYTDFDGPEDWIYVPHPSIPNVWWNYPLDPTARLYAPGANLPNDWVLYPHIGLNPLMDWTYPNTWDGTGSQTFTHKRFYFPPPPVSDALVTRI